VLGKPIRIRSDNGSEFKGSVEHYLKKNNITHIMNEVGDHNSLGVIDAGSKTLKNIIYKHFTANNNTKWIDILDKIVATYNKTPHTSLKEHTPDWASKNEQNTSNIHLRRIERLTKDD